MRKNVDVRRLWLRKLLKLHTLAFTLSLGVYFVLAFFDPGLLSYDVRQKFLVLADDTIAITATVLGPPVQPIITAEVSCDENVGTLKVVLDWADDQNTYTYDVERDTSLLVTGLSSSAYNDTNVVISTTYQYTVTARGPMGSGFAISDPVSVTTPDKCEITASAPVVTIVSLAGKNVDAYDGTPRVNIRRPLFTGTTSISNADMSVVVGSDFIAEFAANGNGYWEWRPPYEISAGDYTFSVTATDPNDSARQAVATLFFNILKKESSESSQDSNSSSTSTNNDPVVAEILEGQSLLPVPEERPVHLSVSLENGEPRLLQGKELKLLLDIKVHIERYFNITIPIRYSLVDKDYNIIFSEIRKRYLTNESEIRESFVLPEYIVPGKYFWQVELLFDHLSVSRVIPFSVSEFPVLELASGKSITYADIVHHLGWLVFFLLFSFLFWSSLFIREFALFLRKDKTVTEYDLRKAGFIRK